VSQTSEASKANPQVKRGSKTADQRFSVLKPSKMALITKTGKMVRLKN
jgi:hypothetical protein